MQAKAEAIAVQVETQYRVKARGGQVEAALVDENLVAVHQEAIAVRGQQLEVRRVDKQLVAGGDKHPLTVKGDASQAAVPAPPLPVDIRRVPVDDLVHDSGA